MPNGCCVFFVIAFFLHKLILSVIFHLTLYQVAERNATARLYGAGVGVSFGPGVGGSNGVIVGGAGVDVSFGPGVGGSNGVIVGGTGMLVAAGVTEVSG